MKKLQLRIELLKTPLKNVPKLHKKIAQQAARETLRHFKAKGEGWPLKWGFLIQDLADKLLGYQVEALLLNELMHKGQKLILKIHKNKFTGQEDFCIMKGRGRATKKGKKQRDSK